MRFLLITLVLVTMVFANTHTIFDDQGDFAAISSSLTFENFSGAQGMVGTFSNLVDPLNYNTDTMLFPLHSVAPGFSIGETSSSNSFLEVLMPEANSNSNVLVGNRFSETGSDIEFSVPVKAFACFVGVYWGPADVNGTDGQVIASTITYCQPFDDSFFGIYTGNQLISKIVFFAPDQPYPPGYDGQFLSNMLFGIVEFDQALSSDSWAAIKYSF